MRHLETLWLITNLVAGLAAIGDALWRVHTGDGDPWVPVAVAFLSDVAFLVRTRLPSRPA